MDVVKLDTYMNLDDKTEDTQTHPIQNQAYKHHQK